MRSVVAILISLLSVASAAPAATATPRPKGNNCDLDSPPLRAGEEMNHGFTLRIYPRAKDIDTRYSGCQVIFAPDGGKWVVVSLTEVVKGDPVRVWAAEDNPARSCRFERGKVVRGDPNKCPDPKYLLLKSMSEGCVGKIRDAVAKHGLGAPRSKECEYQ